MIAFNIIKWIFIKLIVLIKALIFLILFVLLCGTAFVNGFLSEVVRDLPLIENLGVPDIAMTSKIYAADGTLLGDVFGEENRVLVGWHQIPQDLRDAIVATEDQDFYIHPGFDVRGIARAIYHNVTSGDLTGQGASTITQQLVRELYLTRETTYERKIAEIIIAVKIEQKYSKDEILTFYLNQVYFGSNAYGVEAAAQTYFGKSVSECNLQECALLAGLPQAPSRLSPYVDMDAALERRNHVLNRMREALDESGEPYITDEEFEAADAAPIELSGRNDIGFNSLQHPYFCTYVIQQVIDEFGSRRLYTDGLRIYTTLNPEWQAEAERVVNEKVTEFAELDVSEGALVTIDAETGAIRAMVGGADFENSEFNRAWQARRQPGSSFKPYVYLTAMVEGWSPDSLVRDEQITYEIVGSSDYTPHNYDYGYKGIITLRTALALSRNIPAVRVVDRVGAEDVVDIAHACGIRSDLRAHLSMGIGTSEVTLLEHASAYATFANDGVYNQPFAITRITDARGNVLYTYEPESHRAVDSNPIRLLVSMMQAVVTGGTGTRARITGHHIAGKTGTTDDWRDAWFIGFTPSLVTAVWVGNDDFSPMARVTGGRYPAVIWHDYMELVLADMPDEAFPTPALPRLTIAMDWDDSQAKLAAEKEIQDLAEELGIDIEGLNPEQVRAAIARGEDLEDVFGNLRDKEDDDTNENGDDAEGADDGEEGGGDDDSGNDDGGNDDEEDDEQFVWF